MPDRKFLSVVFLSEISLINICGSTKCLFTELGFKILHIGFIPLLLLILILHLSLQLGDSGPELTLRGLPLHLLLLQLLLCTKPITRSQTF